LVVTEPAFTLKGRVLDPAGTVTLPGTISVALSLLTLIVPPAVVASVTAHVADPSCARVVGAHESEMTRVGVARSIGMLREDPLRDAVSIAFWSAVTLPAITTKDVAVAPDATSADVGAVNKALLVDSFTDALPLFDTVTVHVALSPVCSPMDEHVSDVITTACVRLMDAVREDPFSDAVMVAV